MLKESNAKSVEYSWQQIKYGNFDIDLSCQSRTLCLSNNPLTSPPYDFCEVQQTCSWLEKTLPVNLIQAAITFATKLIWQS